GVDERSESIRLRLQDAPAPTVDLVSPLDDVAKKLADVLLDLGLGPAASVGRHLFADPTPNRLIGVEVWAVSGQTHQAQAQVGRGQVGSHGVATVSRAVVPDDDQGPGVVGAQLPQEGDGGLGTAIALDLHRL